MSLTQPLASRITRWLAIGIALTLTTGCATKEYVNEQIASSQAQTDERISGVEGQVEQNQTQLSEQDRRLEDQNQQIAELSGTAQDALERAQEAGKLAEGKFLYEVVFTEDQIRFEFESSELDEAAQQALADFAQRLRDENKNVYLEIQGHTDASGAEGYNQKLGQKRAEAVRRHLSRQGIALHRMNVISYGESEPVADNGTREGRAENRRVSIVVLH
ncbi:MAG: OmpA family protein [Acidobacteriota bacterium]